MNLPEGDMAKLLLDHVNRESYRPSKPSVLAKELKIPEMEQREFKRTIKRLIKSGRISYGANHLIQPASKQQESQFVEGRFKRTSRGFGFVIPHDAEAGDFSNDVFISEDKSLDAADGDHVRAKLYRKRGPYGKRSGRIEEIVERKRTKFVGTYEINNHSGWVIVDGNQFLEPVLVGDAGAKDCQPGDKVVVELLKFPRLSQGGEGVIVEVLGPRGKPGVDTLMIMREFNLPDEFPERVLDDARKQADAFDDTIPENRLDLTAETIITIDPVDARDFDDAISLKRLENGHWQLGVHIADVSHFVRPNTNLDNEAYARATSVYLPDRVIPMLPELISNGLASLQPDRVRFARTAIIEFTASGQRVACEVRRSAIKSCRRFAYEEVDEYLADRDAWKEKLTPQVHQLLGDMHELAMMLRQRRLSKGAIELGLGEVKIDLDKDGKVAGAHKVVNTESHQIIEEFMLAANIAVAESIADRDLFLLRRIHPKPTPKKLKDLTNFVRGLGVECGSLESRFEIKRVLEEVEDEPIGPSINLATLRSMQKAIYSPREEGHYALNEDVYCHFTSPIRRYPDLVIHRMMDALEDEQTPASEFGHLMRLGQHCSLQEQNAEKAERELVKLKLLSFLSERVGEEMDARISGVEPYGVFAQGISIPAEGLIPLELLGDDRFDYDSDTQALIGRRSGEILRLGDPVRVVIKSVDLDRREVDFERVQSGRPATAGKQRFSEERGPDRPRKFKEKSNRGGGAKSKSKVKSKSKSKTKSKRKTGKGKGKGGKR